jgi:hypothetical protein
LATENSSFCVIKIKKLFAVKTRRKIKNSFFDDQTWVPKISLIFYEKNSMAKNKPFSTANVLFSTVFGYRECLIFYSFWLSKMGDFL